MTEDEAKAILVKEGYPTIYTWYDSPDMEYLTHTHPVITTHIITQGDMSIHINGEWKTYLPGQRVDIPAGVIHMARMGPDGCTYVVGEKPF